MKRYNCSIPGERIQIDVCKIAPSRYQFTAIDDCTRWKVLGLYPRPTASNSLKFLEKVIEEMPFPIQIIQTDRGREYNPGKERFRLPNYQEDLKVGNLK